MYEFAISILKLARDEMKENKLNIPENDPCLHTPEFVGSLYQYICDIDDAVATLESINMDEEG